jgi:transcriptional regulator with XRE-family HTH domain
MSKKKASNSNKSQTYSNKPNELQRERLKKCLEDSKITQKQLAELAHYTPQYISDIICGRRNMSIQAARAFSIILKVREEYLLGEDEYKTKEEMRLQNRVQNKEIENEIDILVSYLNTLDIEVLPGDGSCDIIIQFNDFLRKGTQINMSSNEFFMFFLMSKEALIRCLQDVVSIARNINIMKPLLLFEESED